MARDRRTNTLMRIVYDEKFVSKLHVVWEYIAQDSKTRANTFKRELRLNIENIPNFPYKYRRSTWFDFDNTRDLIFKGYTLPYAIYEDKIIVLDIFKWTNH